MSNEPAKPIALVIEDLERWQREVSTILSGAGFSVVVISSLAELQKYDGEEPVLITLDNEIGVDRMSEHFTELVGRFPHAAIFILCSDLRSFLPHDQNTQIVERYKKGADSRSLRKVLLGIAVPLIPKTQISSF